MAAPVQVGKHGPAGLIIARPTEQGAALARKIRAEGGQAWIFPTIEIRELLPDPDSAGKILAGADWIIFVSANAVQHGWPLMQFGPGLQPRLAAVGQATATLLATKSHLPVLCPQEGADSEALLALPAMQDISGQKVVIVRGLGGREWLKQALEARGAVVSYLECYERRLATPDSAVLDQALSSEAAVSVMSAESLRNLWLLAGELQRTLLLQCNFLVPHPRVAEEARSLGIRKVYLTGPGNEAIVTCWKNLKPNQYD